MIHISNFYICGKSNYFPLNSVFLHLGSNKNQPLKQLLTALGKIEEQVGKITAYSQIYKTEAWGKKDQDDFINMAIEVDSQLEALEILNQTQQIEKSMGRLENEKWAARIIDIDLLFYESQIITHKELSIPHPHIEKRNFVLIPLMDIAAKYEHPVMNKTIEELYLLSKDECEVIRL